MSHTAQCRAVDSDDALPVILQHPLVAQRLTSYQFDGGQQPRQTPVARAKLEHDNCKCPSCRRVTVRPIQLEDALLDRRGLEIPGTATIVGFYCTTCRHEWLPQTPRLRLIAGEE